MRSANETSGMVLKAARGAGMSIGCAEELGRAAPALAAQGALDCVNDLLKQPFDVPQLVNGSVCDGHPVQAVLAWRDLKAAGVDATLACEVPQVLFDALCAQTSICGPFEVNEQVWDQLSDFAAKTLVPESDASRLAGAGAGLTDND